MIHDTPIRQHYEKKYSQGLVKRPKKKKKEAPDNHLKVNMVSSVADVLCDLEQATYCSGFLFPSQLSHKE